MRMLTLRRRVGSQAHMSKLIIRYHFAPVLQDGCCWERGANVYIWNASLRNQSFDTNFEQVHEGISPHLCVGFLFLILYPGLLLRLLLPPSNNTLSTHTLSTHTLSTHTLSTHTLSTHFVHTHFINTHFVHTHFVHTHFVHTLYQHTLCQHTLCPHTLCPHILCQHTLCPHTLCPHTLCPHTLSTHTLSTHTLSTHTLSTHTLSTHTFSTHTLSTHTHTPTTLCPHTHTNNTLSTHTLSTHTLSTHTLSTHTLSTHFINTHFINTHFVHTHFVHTHFVHTHFVHTLYQHTLYQHTLCPHTLCPHTLSQHTLCPHTHTLCPHTLSQHTLCPHTHTRAHAHTHTHPHTHTVVLRGRRGTDGTGWRAWSGLGARDAAALCVAGVALGDIYPRFTWQASHKLASTVVLRGRRGTDGTGWRAWSGLGARDAAALCVAGVALGDIHLRFTWQAWHELASTVVWRGRRGTDGTGWRAWSGLGARDAALLCVAGVALGDIYPRFTWQASHKLASTVVLRGRRGTDGTGWRAWSGLGARDAAALCVAGVALGDIHLRFTWQTWHELASTVVWRGRRGTDGTGWRAWSGLGARDAAALGVAGVALGDIHLRFAWQAWHKLASTVVSRGRRGTNSHPQQLVSEVNRSFRRTNSHPPSFCVAGVALMVLGGALGPGFGACDAAALCVAGVAQPHIHRRFTWQAWHKLTHTYTHTDKHPHTHRQTHTHTQTNTHRQTHTHTHARTHAHIHAHAHTHTHTPTHTHDPNASRGPSVFVMVCAVRLRTHNQWSRIDCPSPHFLAWGIFDRGRTPHTHTRTHTHTPHTQTQLIHTQLTHTYSSTHNLLHTNPSPSLFSFLLTPCRLCLSFVACWKKLTCGVIRSFNFFSAPPPPVFQDQRNFDGFGLDIASPKQSPS